MYENLIYICLLLRHMAILYIGGKLDMQNNSCQLFPITAVTNLIWVNSAPYTKERGRKKWRDFPPLCLSAITIPLFLISEHIFCEQKKEYAMMPAVHDDH